MEAEGQSAGVLQYQANPAAGAAATAGASAAKAVPQAQEKVPAEGAAGACGVPQQLSVGGGVGGLAANGRGVGSAVPGVRTPEAAAATAHAGFTAGFPSSGMAAFYAGDDGALLQQQQQLLQQQQLVQQQQQPYMHPALPQQPPQQVAVDPNTRNSSGAALGTPAATVLGGLADTTAAVAQGQQTHVVPQHQQQSALLPQHQSFPHHQPSAPLQDSTYQQQQQHLAQQHHLAEQEQLAQQHHLAQEQHLALQQQYVAQQQQQQCHPPQQLQHYSLTQQQQPQQHRGGDETQHSGAQLAAAQQQPAGVGQQVLQQEQVGKALLTNSSSSTCAASNIVPTAPSVSCPSALPQPERLLQSPNAAGHAPAAAAAALPAAEESTTGRAGGASGCPVPVAAAVGGGLRSSEDGEAEAAAAGLDDAELSAHAAAAVDFAVAAGAVALDGWSGRAVVSSTTANPHLAVAAAALQAAAAAAPPLPPVPPAPAAAAAVAVPAQAATAANLPAPAAAAGAHPATVLGSGMAVVAPAAPASCGGASGLLSSAAVAVNGGALGAPAAYAQTGVAATPAAPAAAAASSSVATVPPAAGASCAGAAAPGGKPLAAGGSAGAAAAGTGAVAGRPASTRRRGMSSKNEVWRERLRLLEPFLDVEGILLMKQCCRLFYRHKYRPAEGILRFQQLRGFDPKVVMEQVLPLVCRSVHAGVRQRGLLLDFSHCVLIRDGSIARLMDAVHGEPEENQILGKLRGLHLNYCNEITEKGLAAMFTTYLPHLEVLRMRCARSTELTYISSLSHLSSERWPSLIVFDASFTYLWLDAATAIADCLFDNAARLTTRRREQESRLRKEKREKRRELLRLQELERMQQQQNETQLLVQQQQVLQLQQQRQQHQAMQQQQQGGGGDGSAQHLEELDLLLGKENTGGGGTAEKGDRGNEEEEGEKKKEDGNGTQQLLDVEEIPVLQSPLLAPQSYTEQTDIMAAAGIPAKTPTGETLAAAGASQLHLPGEDTTRLAAGSSTLSSSNTAMLGAADGKMGGGHCGGSGGEAAGAGSAAAAAGQERNEQGMVVTAVPAATAPAAAAPAAGPAAVPPVVDGVWGENTCLQHQTEEQEEQEDLRAIAEIFITPTMEILGSVASKNLLLKIGLEGLYRSFCCALTSGDVDGVAHAVRRMQRELSELASRAPYNGSHLLVLQQFRGAELLVNAPLIVETPEEGGVTVATLPISTAIQKGDSNMLNLLLRSGAKIDVCDYLGKSPVYLACETGRKDFVELLLLQHGASPQAVDIRSPFSPLHMAIKRADVNTLKLLLSKGASLDVRCPAVKTYKSALFVACEANSKEAIQLCLKAGADPNWRGQNSNTPALLAYQLSSAWLPQFVAAGAGRPLRRRWVLTDLLSNAIFRGDVSSVELLIREFPDLLVRDHQLWSKPLIQAAKQGKAEVISALLAAGCPLDVRTDAGQTPLMAAAQEDFVGCVQLLLDRGANINDIDYDGLTALHVASTENRMEVAKLLLLRGCDVNVGDKENGETALMMAIRMRNEKMALQILEQGKNLDMEKKNVKGETALLYAMFFGQYPVAGQLMDRGAVSVSDHMGDSAYIMACERMMTPGADKRVLRKFIRLHKAAQTRTNSSNSRNQAFMAAAAGVGGKGEEPWSAYTAGEESAASGVDSGPDGGALVRQLQQQQAAAAANSSSSTSYRKGSGGRVRAMKSFKMYVGNVSGAGSSSQQQQPSSGSSGHHGGVVAGVGGLLLGSGASRSSNGRAAERQTAAGPKAGDSSVGSGGAAATAAEESLQSGATGAAAPQRRSKGSGTGSGGKKLKLETKTVLQVARLPITLFRAAKAK